MPPRLANRLLRQLSATLPFAILFFGCLKSLDESLLDAKDAGAGSGGTDGGGTGGTGGKDGGTGATGGTGGTGATGGTGGADGGGTGGTDGGGTGGSDAGDGGVIAYDPSKFPVTNIVAATAPVVLATDDTDIFYTVDNGINEPLNRIPLAGGANTTLLTLERPHTLIAPATSSFIFAGGGQNSGNGGTLIRTDKVGGAAQPITTSTGSMGPAIGLVASADGFAYVTFQADPSIHKPALARFDLASGTSAAVLYNAVTDESGGRVVTAGGCAYWVSSGHIFTMPSGGAPDVASGLMNQVSNAVGLAASASTIYYTLSTGSVWSRQVTALCDGTGPGEKKLTEGFTGIGDVIVFRTAPTIAWSAQGNLSSNFAGGGIFMMPAAGGQVTQIAPQDSGPATLIDAPSDVVFAVTSGEIRRVPKP
jgi:hypothetical protein